MDSSYFSPFLSESVPKIFLSDTLCFILSQLQPAIFARTRSIAASMTTSSSASSASGIRDAASSSEISSIRLPNFSLYLNLQTAKNTTPRRLQPPMPEHGTDAAYPALSSAGSGRKEIPYSRQDSIQSYLHHRSTPSCLVLQTEPA